MKIPSQAELGITTHGSLAQLVKNIYLDPAPDSPHVRCFVTLNVRDAEDEEGHTINVTTCNSLHYSQAEGMTLAAWRAWVCHNIRTAWLHELDEGLKIDGRHVNDPHPGAWPQMKPPEPMKLRAPEDFEL